MSFMQPEHTEASSPDGSKPLQVVSFWDGRPGHEKQTRGVVNALARLTRIEEVPRTVQPLSGPRRIRSWLSFYVLPAKAMGPNIGVSHPDLIIGTGSATHIPMLVLKKTSPRVRVVTCMEPEFPVQRRMDLCFIPRHDRPKPADNIVETIGPPNNLSFTDAHDRRRGLILVGGLDPRRHHWDSTMLMDQIRTLVQRAPDCSWTISSSPRTPPETIEKLEALAARTSAVQFYNARHTPNGWIERQYVENRTAWITADSVSMVYEALTAGCRVGILPVRWRRKEDKFQEGLNFLVAHRYATPYDVWLTGGHMAAAGVRLDEASRCARELLRRWWPSRLR